MTVIVNDRLCPESFNIEARTLCPKGAGANSYGRDAIRAGAKARQFQCGSGRQSAPPQRVNATAIQGPNKQGRTRTCKQSATSDRIFHDMLPFRWRHFIVLVQSAVLVSAARRIKPATP
jgi:hypothetical protein